MVSITPQYLPPQIDEKKHKQKRILLVSFLVLLFAISFFLFWFFNRKEPVKEVLFATYRICDLEPQQQNDLFTNREQLEFKSFNDYLFYGESLSLYETPYVRGENDGFIGQTIQFRNLCNNEIHSFLISSELDRNIPVNELPEGFYSVLIQNNLNAYRLVYPDVIDQRFTTITRNNKRLDVHLIADRMKFTNVYDQSLLLNDNELFVEVKEKTIDEEIIDIVLDPKFNSQDFGMINLGTEMEGFTEAQETYRFAHDVQKRLQEYGLKVLLTRPNEELIVNTYGDKGRVHTAMSHEAKLMVEFYFENLEDRNLNGTSIYGSNYASLNLQQTIINRFQEANLPIFIGTRGQVGAFYNLYRDDLDSNNLIRESGGYALGAGEFSDVSSRLNTFAVGNRLGVHTVSMNLLMTSNWDFKETYAQNYNAMVEATVLGLLDYLGIQP